MAQKSAECSPYPLPNTRLWKLKSFGHFRPLSARLCLSHSRVEDLPISAAENRGFFSKIVFHALTPLVVVLPENLSLYGKRDLG